MASPGELFLQDLEDLLRSCKRQAETGFFEENFFECCRRRLEYFISVLGEISGVGRSVVLVELLEETRPWLVWLDSQPTQRSICCSAPATVLVQTGGTGSRGRPS